MEREKEKSRRPLIACIVLFILYSFSPSPAPAFEKVFRNSLGMKFVHIPAGVFLMGSPLNEPHRNGNEVQHQVTISRPFYLQTSEVTLKQWRALMGTSFFAEHRRADTFPVTRVSWYDCMDFIKALNEQEGKLYRLPTEAEWEYACRAGSTAAYYWGDGIDCSKAMYGNCSEKDSECTKYIKSRGLPLNGPVPVGSYQPNAWGLCDMSGNVWEWCRDDYGAYPTLPVVDPVGPQSGSYKVRRGGSWFKYGYYCRSANRNFAKPSDRYRTTGFRIVLEVR
jgi:formylglycine-generating enzyme required for sulfatase activity